MYALPGGSEQDPSTTRANEIALRRHRRSSKTTPTGGAIGAALPVEVATGTDLDGSGALAGQIEVYVDGIPYTEAPGRATEDLRDHRLGQTSTSICTSTTATPAIIPSV